MENHIDRRVILSQDSKHPSLDGWSLQELDADGNKVGGDQIPWEWGLYFTASELWLHDTITIKPEYQHDSEDEKMAVRESRSITATLHPRRPRDRDSYRETSFSMFGTDRTISDFDLCIQKLEDGDEQERCEAVGVVSYTAEIDFRRETTADCVGFLLYVRPETFARYAEKIAASAADEVVLGVAKAAGFYSEWSPSAWADEIKVLVKNKEHEVEIPSECEIDPPRLGKVKEASLYFHRVTKLEKARPETSEEAEEWTGNEELPEEPSDGAGQVQPNLGLAIADPRAVNLLSSVRIATWIIAGLLLLILIT